LKANIEMKVANNWWLKVMFTMLQQKILHNVQMNSM